MEELGYYLWESLYILKELYDHGKGKDILDYYAPYPFSNVYAGGSICLGNNALPAYKDPTRISTLANYILRLPNNNDNFSAVNNKLKLGYRELLEHLKDKQPEYYYSDILIPDGKTLKDFITGR